MLALFKILDISLSDKVFKSNENAINFARQLALKEGILAGISSGAALANQVANRPEM